MSSDECEAAAATEPDQPASQKTGKESTSNHHLQPSLSSTGASNGVGKRVVEGGREGGRKGGERESERGKANGQVTETSPKVSLQ